MTHSKRLDQVSELTLELVSDNKLLWMAIEALSKVAFAVKDNIVLDIPRTQADWAALMEDK